ncbi:MAG: hypothetical protein VWZ97_00590 [Flavobacteriaceae bacterium]|jgi:hypothetical protein
MEISILIAKILGLSYLSLALGILFNTSYYRNELVKILDNSAILLYGGFLSIVLGLIIINYHNSWNDDWTTVITIVGYVALVKGMVLLIAPGSASLYKNNIFHPNNILKVLVPMLLVLGLLFGYFGFIK